MEDRMRFCELITFRRKKLNMTQLQLAEKMMVSKSAIAKWETGGGIPDRENMYKLSEILGVPLDFFHKVISNNVEELNKDFECNITADVISALESFGYRVLRPYEVAELEAKEKKEK